MEAISNTGTVIGSEPSERWTAQPRWGTWKQIGFRFLFSYFILFGLDCLSFLVSFTAYDLSGNFIPGFMDPVWTPAATWIGRHIFGMSGFSAHGFGNGGRTDYVQAFSLVLVASLAAIIWSWIDRKRTNYRRLLEWLRLYVQFFLATMMLSYGFVKIIPNQFGLLTPERMSSRVGDLS